MNAPLKGSFTGVNQISNFKDTVLIVQAIPADHPKK